METVLGKSEAETGLTCELTLRVIRKAGDRRQPSDNPYTLLCAHEEDRDGERRQPETKNGEEEEKGEKKDILLQQTLPTRHKTSPSRHETGAGQTSTGSPLVFNPPGRERVRTKQETC